MKKLIVFCSVVIFSIAAHAQADSLQQYTGKYKFPDGSIISEATVTLENGSLFVNSTAGSSALTKDASPDAFIIVQFQGVAIFKRDSNKKIIGVSINAMGYQLEGNKEYFAYFIKCNLKQQPLTN